MIIQQTWSPDIPDHRDALLSLNLEGTLNEYILNFDGNESHVDLCELLPNSKGSPFDCAVSNACCLAIEYFESNCRGLSTRLSRSFLSKTARLMEGVNNDSPISVRAALKAVKRFGIPPEKLVRYVEQIGIDPVLAPACYSYDKELPEIRYLRIPLRDYLTALKTIKQLVRSRLPCIAGFSVPSSWSNDLSLDFRPNFDSVVATGVGLICGFDDDYRIVEKGALVISGPVDNSWGQDGFARIPYSFLEYGMIADIWVIMSSKWLVQLRADIGLE